MKNIIKILFIVIIFALCFSLKAQTIITPEPTGSSIQNYVNANVSPARGIPSINIPLFELETTDANLPVALSLSYHPYNAKANVPASEVGAGWSLFKGSMITRESYAKYNEFTEISALNKRNADHFYYSIPGHSGRFTIYKDSISGNLQLHNLSGEKIKIDFTRDINSTKLIINSFKITDDKGYQYIFDNYNISSWSEPGIPYGRKTQRSSYVITSIKKADNTDIITYGYDIKTRYINNTPNIPKYKLCKLNTITTCKGQIKFEYDYNAYFDNSDNYNNDFYTINNISLVSNSGKVISKYKFIKSPISAWIASYAFETPTPILGSKLGLNRLLKLDSNDNIEESTDFFYNEAGSDTQYGYFESPELYGLDVCNNSTLNVSPKKEVIGLLQRIVFPTGGSVVYDFEASEVYADRTNEDYTDSNILTEPLFQYFDNTNIEFNTNLSRTYTFTVTGVLNVKYPVRVSKGIDGEDYGLTTTHGEPYTFNFSVLDSSNTVMKAENYSCNDIFSKALDLLPGTYTIKINNWGGKGNFAVTQLKSLPKPYKNYKTIQIGARIKRITYFDHNNEVQKQRLYEYNMFSDSLSSSGYQFANENTTLATELDGFVLYRNVKEKEVSGNQNNGYTEYYFDTPEDYKDALGNIMYYYNETSQGILTKKNIYNSQNKLLESSQYEYNFEEIQDADTQYVYYGYITTVPSWIKYIKETSISYLGQSLNKTIKETTFNPANFQEMLSKITTNNGDVNEVNTRYAQDLGNTRLINANMISVPLQIETKTDGILMSKVITKYDNTNHFYPTSLESTDLAQTNETQMSFDLYDNKGNLVQTTDKSGNSITTIWGYYNTLPIAQIVGAKYNDISSLPVVTAAINASNSDADDPANEAALLTALENLRLAPQLQQYSLTVSTYDPLVGVTNAISSGGIKTSYEYDSSGRLLKVKNSEGQVLKENQYNYKH